jgi:hypothetical protein
MSAHNDREAYEAREFHAFQRDMREVERLPLAERKENARTFTHTLQVDPGLVAERVGWLLNGSYGAGSYAQAQQVARSPRMNQAAWLVQTIAALEWHVPPKMTIAAWKTLSMAQRTKLDRLIKKEINPG